MTALNPKNPSAFVVAKPARVVYALALSASLVIAVSVLGTTACFPSVDHSETAYSCIEDPVCPSGYDCVNGTCLKNTGVDAGPDARPVELVRGDLLYYSFDNDNVAGLAHDRSGNRFDGEIRGPELVDGKFGSSLKFEENDVVVRDSPKLFAGSTITIEAYVLHLVGQELGAIYSDDEVNAQPDSVEYSLAIDTQDRLEFKTNGGCGEGVLTYNSEATVGTVNWHHVAVVWDGATISFYIDGVLSGQATNAKIPCESLEPRAYRIGRLSNEAGAFNGLIDDLKVSGVAKSETDILASMAYNSDTGDTNFCGDNLIEDEACEPANACCTPDCQPAAEASECPLGGSCNALGACTRPGGRVTLGIQALYEFNDGVDALVVADTSAVDPALDLTIPVDAPVTWGTGTLSIDGATALTSAAAAKIEAAVEASDEVTVEAWIETTPGQPLTPRVVSLAQNSGTRNINIAQSKSSYYSNIRSSLTTAGRPLIDSPAGDIVANKLTHILVARTSDGIRRVYIDGVLRSRNVVGGTMDNWAAYPLTLANATGGGQPWLGTFHLVAIYGRALTSADVAQNFAAGAD